MSNIYNIPKSTVIKGFRWLSDRIPPMVKRKSKETSIPLPGQMMERFTPHQGTHFGVKPSLDWM